MEEKKTYDYKYSSDVNDEIRRIQKKYDVGDPKYAEKERLLSELRSIDRSTTRSASIIALSEGIIGACIVVFGMGLAMLYSESMLIAGIFIGILGVAVALPAYPVYKRISEKKKEKNSPLIRELSEKLQKEM